MPDSTVLEQIRRSRELLAAQLSVLDHQAADPDDWQTSLQALAQEQRKSQSSLDDAWGEADRRARASGVPLRHEEVEAIRRSIVPSGQTSPEAILIRQTLGRLAASNAEFAILEASPTPFRPGRIYIRGHQFGASPGRVWLEFPADVGLPPAWTSYPTQPDLDTKIISWTQAASTGEFLDTIVVEVPERPALTPGRCALHVERADGAQALIRTNPNNSPFFLFQPLYRRYLARAQLHLSGGLFGLSTDDVFLRGQTLGWPYRLDGTVTVTQYGGGWAAPSGPVAFGDTTWDPSGTVHLEQGYHVGIPALQDGYTDITYAVSAPNGYPPPPPVVGLPPWGWYGDSP